MKPRIRTIFIKPGELIVIQGEVLITTVLGSCVSLILHNARTGMSGFCHAVLPQSNTAEPGYQFVDQAFTHLLRQFLSSGISPAEIRAQLYGGADMFAVGRNRTGVGHKNIAAAQEILQRYRLNLVARDTGGLRGRKLIFHSDSGKVRMDLLARRQEPNRASPRARQPLSISGLRPHPEQLRSRLNT